MAPRIYPSPLPPTEISERSIFTQVFSKSDRIASDFPAFIDASTGTVLTRGTLYTKSLELGFGFRNVLSVTYGGPKLKRGDTVLVFSPNSIAYPLIVFGLFAAGLKATLANSAYTYNELAHQYHDSRASVVVAHPSLVSVVLEMFKQSGLDAAEARGRIIIANWGSQDKAPGGFLQLDDLLGKGRLEKEENFDGPLSNETTLLCYSSGTTGKPKGVETTHRNLCSVINMIGPLFPIEQGKDVTLGVLPFFHIYGATNILQYCLLEGIPVVVMPRFEPEAYCKYIEQYKVTFGFIVPPILVVLSRHPAVAKYNLTSLKRLVSGAAPLGAGLTKAVSERLKSYGVETSIVQGYGLTETSPTSHMLLRDDHERKIGSIGYLMPNLEARFVKEDGTDAEPGEPGELWMRGPSIMKGYLNRPDATSDSITPDGFFKTGDIALMDEEGFYYIVDRKKELIKYKGFQVPPAELESVLLQHPDIADTGVVGIDSHVEATELPRAYVVHARGLPATEQERSAFASSVQKWIEGRVAKHKFLRGGVVVIDAIPKSASGKILRRELRERAKKEVEAQEAATPLKAKL